jgi:hypothetical protein
VQSFEGWSWLGRQKFFRLCKALTDELHAYKMIGKKHASHQWVNHKRKEYSCGDTHNNTAESFNAMLERAKQGVFHYLSKKHLSRYPFDVANLKYGFYWVINRYFERYQMSVLLDIIP